MNATSKSKAATTAARKASRLPKPKAAGAAGAAARGQDAADRAARAAAQEAVASSRAEADPQKTLPDPGEPTPEQLAKAESETQKALKELERQGAGDSTLSRYFREMAHHRVMTPAEEVEAAKEVERLEIAYWEALLSYPPAYETVACVLEHHLSAEQLKRDCPEVGQLRRLARQAKKGRRFDKRAQKRWDQLAKSLAAKLRELDSDRIFVRDADKAVHRLAGMYAEERDLEGDVVRITAAFRDYLRRVEQAREAQQRAKNRFVAANLRLVVSVARRYNRGRLPLIDLIQEGNIGLMKAVERFDHKRGYRFSTYASWWIRHAISRALADKGRAVRIPVHMLDTYNRVARASQIYATRTGKEPTTEELEKELGISAEKLEKIRGYWAETPFSLDRPVNDEDGRRFIDFLEQENVPTPYEQLEQRRWADQVQELLKQLTPMEARILRWRFGLDNDDELTLKEIGDKYNLSRERIRQLQEQALSKIRRKLKD